MEQCQSSALEIKGQKVTVEEMVAEIKKDVRFYEKIGGGFTSKEVLRQLLPVTDLFLYDYKITENADTYIGVSDKVILENLDYLLAQGANVRLRCPIIPDINDNQAHFEAIAALSKHQELVGIDILPYHNMGVYKSYKLGRNPWDSNRNNMSEQQKEKTATMLALYGCRKFRIL